MRKKSGGREVTKEVKRGQYGRQVIKTDREVESEIKRKKEEKKTPPCAH